MPAIPTNIGSSAAAIPTGVLSVSNLLLVTPQSTIGYQPQANTNSPVGLLNDPPAILFNYEGEQTVTLQSDITDHYVEDNTAIQDQIALRPERITTHGFIGELNDIVTNPLLLVLQTAVQKLNTIQAYSPALTLVATIEYNEAVFAANTLIQAVNALGSTWASINNTGGESFISGAGITIEQNQSKQQVAFQSFYAYWRTRTLFTVQTPWAVFQNMAIESLRAIQDAETRVITDFEVTFKLIRFAQAITTNFQIDPASAQGRLAYQAASLVNNGPSTPSVSSTTLNDAISGVF